jgi:hypothetical protein
MNNSKNNSKNNRTEDILGSLDGCQRAEVPSFFYTRLKARMEKESDTSTARIWLLRPAFAGAALLVILAINTFVLLKGNTIKEETSSDTDSIQAIAAEYSLNDNSTLYDLNQDK